LNFGTEHGRRNVAVTATIATLGGRIDRGEQRTPIADARRFPM